MPLAVADTGFRWNGRVLIIGFAAGDIEKVAMNKVLLKNISLVVSKCQNKVPFIVTSTGC